MDIKTAEDKFQKIHYADSSYDELLSHLTKNIDNKEHHLSLFLGLYAPDKEIAIKEFEQKLKRKVEIIETDELVHKNESKTFEKLDELFENLDQSEAILYFKNGGKLCGAYTGFSKSRVKYATPQERYFLGKVKKFNGLVIVDIEEFTDADKTMRRAAQSIISFTLPDSKLKRFWWHLRNFSPHGFELKTKRPEAYHEKEGHF